MRPQPRRRRTSSHAASRVISFIGGPQRPHSGVVEDERGAVLPLMALILVLLGTTGLAVDLGWVYWNSLEIQHGADTAALGGVVYTAESFEKAEHEGRAVAALSGYVDEDLGGPDIVDIITFEKDPTAVGNDSELRATITHEVPTFFMKVFGLNSVRIQRTAVARYVLPLALGSPESYFGNDPSLGIDQGLWGSIHGTYTPKRDGDRFSALCDGSGSGSSCEPNPEQRPSSNWGTVDAEGGFLYGIDVAEGATGLTVEIFDGPYFDGGGSLAFAGDSSMSSSDDIVTWFMLYGPDPTPLDTTDGNELLCTVRYESRDDRSEYPGWDPSWTSFEEAPSAVLASMWDSMATSPDQQFCVGDLDRGPGTYPLRVMIEHSSTQKGRNKYSLRVGTMGSKPYIYGLGDIGIYANVEPGGSTEFYLAEVEEKQAGKNLIIELWDPGDVTGGNSSDHVTVYDGFHTVPECSWTATNGDSGDLGPCVVTTGGKIFNGHLVTMVVPIPQDYTCSGDTCWFKIKYTYPTGEVHDSTTWAAYIEGNPIRLVG